MKKTRRAPIHPLFDKCSKIIDDEFWVDLLTKCGQNRFPSGFMYKDGYLTHKRGKRMDKIYLSTDPEIAIDEIRNFFGEKDHIYSKRDKEERMNNEEFIPLPDINDWSTLKKSKKLCEIVLYEYIEKVAIGYNLDKEEKKQLKTVVNMAMIQDYFNNDTVEVHKNSIINIKGLAWDETERVFALPSHKRKVKASKSTSRRVDSSSARGKTYANFYALWIEFLKTIPA